MAPGRYCFTPGWDHQLKAHGHKTRTLTHPITLNTIQINILSIQSQPILHTLWSCIQHLLTINKTNLVAIKYQTLLRPFRDLWPRDSPPCCWAPSPRHIAPSPMSPFLPGDFLPHSFSGWWPVPLALESLLLGGTSVSCSLWMTSCGSLLLKSLSCD